MQAQISYNFLFLCELEGLGHVIPGEPHYRHSHWQLIPILSPLFIKLLEVETAEEFTMMLSSDEFDFRYQVVFHNQPNLSTVVWRVSTEWVYMTFECVT